MTTPAHPSAFSFSHPEGLTGRLAARMMGIAGRARSRAVMQRLDLRAGDRVLEIGFGAADDLVRAAALVRPGGSASGIDSSQTLVRQAQRRLQRGSTKGGGRVLRSSADDPFPFDDGAFDRAYSINSFQFWENQRGALSELRRVLVPGGRCVLAVQPKGDLARHTTPSAILATLSDALEDAGFVVVAGDLVEMRPRATAIVTALRPRGSELV